MPLRMGDTDMWYHLNGGRYFWEHGSIPATAFFSFIEPQPEWTNYFWGFQAIIYQVHNWTDYYGLAFLRSVLGISTILLFFLILKKELVRNNFTLFLILLISILIIYEGRFFQLRPHLFSYFFILLFFYILHFRTNWSPALPILTIIWANIHGVEWPVPALICGSYALPILIKLYKKQPTDIDKPIRYLLSISACAVALLINPYGWELYLAPFSIDADTNQYIGELLQLNLTTVTTIELSWQSIPIHTALSTLFILTNIFFLIGLLKRKLPLPTIILHIAGLYLLSRGTRFIWEWLLLCTPMLLFMLEQHKQQDKPALPSWTRHLLLGSLVFMLLSSLWSKSLLFGEYPFDQRNLPRGLDNFISKTGATGKLMTNPNTAGYLEWKTFPHFKTFIDMQFPPANDRFMYQISQAYKTQAALDRFIATYEVDWLTISLTDAETRKHIEKNSDFVPVYTNDVLVLYANKKTQKQITDIHHLKYLDPFSMKKTDEASNDDFLSELNRLLDIAEYNPRVIQALSSYFLEKKELQQALYYSEKLVEQMPYNPNSYRLHGKILRDMNHYDKAIDMFEKSIAITGSGHKHLIEQEIAVCYYMKNDFTEAHKRFSNSINPYLNSISSELLYMYALSSTISGDLEKAMKLLEMLEFSYDNEEQGKIIKQAQELKSQIMNGEFDVPSFIDWILS